MFEGCPLILLVISWVTAQFYYLNPWSTFLGVLHFASFVVVNLRGDFHLQDRAHAGRTVAGEHCYSPALLVDRNIKGFTFYVNPRSKLLHRKTTGCRVGTSHCCDIPPSEPGGRVSPYRARAVRKPWIHPRPAVFHERSVYRGFRRSEYRALSGSSREIFEPRSSGPTRDETGWPVLES